MDDPQTALFLDHRPGLLRYLQARGVGNEAEDILQELWLRLKATSSEIGEPRAYLYRSAHNIMIDRARQHRRRAAREQVFQQADGTGPAGGTEAMAEHALIARQRLDAVDRVLVALGPKTNRIFRRFRIERIPQHQIARELGITLSAVEKHLQKAYKAIAHVQLEFRAEDRGTHGADADVAG